MPRYFLNIEHFDGARVLDDNGSDYADLNAAKEDARLTVIEMIYEAMRDDKARVPLRIVVLDDSGTEAAQISSHSVLPPELQN
ncbi:DUF6894 family protein [Tardiphaga sp.]|uniref:DUF6894 family protein n=1 Tax=Tardiphaga sp. TaxID=1926292 RepID=UPI0037DA1FF1